MSHALKCPNHSCPYLFDPSSVPTGVVLACPRCGMRFTLGPPASPPEHYPGAPALNALAAANPILPFGSAATDGQAPTAASPAQPGPLTTQHVHPAGSAVPSANRPRTKKKLTDRPHLPVRESGFQRLILAGIAAVLMAGTGIAIWYKLSQKPEEPETSTTMLFKEVNLGIEPLTAPWTRDEQTKGKLGSPYFLVYRRDNPDAYIAFGARDYDPSSPRASDLRRYQLEPLGQLLEAGTLQSFPLQDPKWMGQEATGFKFRGQLKTGSSIEGESYAVVNKGIAYWYLAWTGENEIYQEQRAAFAEARSGTKLLDLRNDWKEKQSPIVTFKNNVIGYTLLDGEGQWKEVTGESDLKAEGPEADKLLRLVLGRKANTQHIGSLVVFVLPASTEPLVAAKEFITSKRVAELAAANPDFTVEFQERAGPIAGATAPVGVEPTAPVLRLQSRVANASGQDRLHVISAKQIGDKVIAVHAWGDLSERELFEGVFVQIASSLRASE